ncbi:hypothetical protein BCV72DRAFT_183097, partial [Rhizopus microsporus var. microsporus]
LLEHCPFIEEGFFCRPLPDTERRRFLFECPKNTIRSYDPSELNKVNLSSPAGYFDTQCTVSSFFYLVLLVLLTDL